MTNYFHWFQVKYHPSIKQEKNLTPSDFLVYTLIPDVFYKSNEELHHGI